MGGCRTGRSGDSHPPECVTPDDVLIQVGPPDDEHLLLETCRGVEINTLRKSASSWSLTRITFYYTIYDYTTQTNKMHISKTNILIFNFDFHMFRNRGFIFRKTVVYIVMVGYVLHAPV